MDRLEEYSLIKVGGKIIFPVSSQMAIMFLSMLKASYNGYYPIHRENAPSFDAQLMNKKEDQDEELT